jgi:hypothetical protein
LLLAGMASATTVPVIDPTTITQVEGVEMKSV